METMRFNCELCGGRIEVSVSLCGQRVVCPVCNGLVMAPSRAAGASDVRRTSRELTHVSPGSEHSLTSTRVRVAGWSVSVLLHALLVLLFMAVTWVAGGGGGAARGTDVDIAVMDNPVTIEEKPHEPLRLDAPETTAPPIPQPASVELTLVEVQTPAETTAASSAEAVIAVAEAVDAVSFERFTPPPTPATEFANLPPIYRNRAGAGKTAALAKFGGKGVEKAIEKGLAWLAENQRPDGSWGKPATTGLALLAFLGDGHTTAGGKYQKNVSRGFEALVGQGRWNGESFQFDGDMYHQGIATFALAEECVLNHESRFRKTAQGAVNDIVAAQYRDGGWRYGRSGYSGDTSVFGWQIMALKAARGAELNIPATTWTRAAQFLNKVKTEHAETAGFGYTGPGPTWVLSGVGLVCLQFMESRDRALMEKVARGPLAGPAQANHIYGIYYVSIGLFQLGGKHWERWNNWMKPHLTGTQHRDGHWEGYALSRRSSFPDAYSTALSVLTLEVYYRYTPLYAEKP